MCYIANSVQCEFCVQYLHSVLADKSLEIAERLIEVMSITIIINVLFPINLQLNVVAYLMYAMGNTSYVESQRQASIALAVSSHTSTLEI